MKRLEIKLTEEQEQLLKKRSQEAGFHHKSEYVRFVLFLESSIIKKIDAIYKKIVRP